MPIKALSYLKGLVRRSAIVAVAFVIFATMAGAPAFAQGDQAEPRSNTPSGYPVPRFVSLKSEETFCRTGPSFAHDIRLTFQRRGLPVIVIAETQDHWRKIRDADGDECWVHKSKLSGRSTAVVIDEGLELRAVPRIEARPRARLGEGVIAQVEKSDNDWLKVKTSNMRGWARRSGFWGGKSEDLPR